MIVETDYQRGAAGDLLSYMERGDNTLHNHVGEEMTQAEKTAFLEESQENEFERQIIIAPERDDLDADDLHSATRDTMTEFLDDHPTAEYCYAVHDDDDENPHVHVAATGDIDDGDLYMERDDIRELRDDIAADRFGDRSLEERREQLQEQQQEPQQEVEHNWVPQEEWKARLEARKQAQEEEQAKERMKRERAQMLAEDRRPDVSLQDVKEKIDEKQRRHGPDWDDDQLFAGVLSELDDLDELDERDLDDEVENALDDLEQSRGLER
jgi:hypothetical protein